MSEKINHKGWRGEDRSGKFHKHFLTHLSKKITPALPLFSLPKPRAIYHTDRKSETHWVGWSIASPFVVFVVKVGKLTRSAFCMDCRPGRPCTSDCSAFCARQDLRSSPTLWERTGVFFFRLLTDPFLNKDIQVSSLSNSESTVTVARAFPTYRHPDDSIDMLFNIDETTPEVYPPISSLSYFDFSKCPGESVKPH